MTQSIFAEFAPLVRQAWHEFIEQRIAGRSQTAIESGTDSQGTTVIKPRAKRPKLKKPTRFISKNSVEIPVFVRYLGRRFEATLFFNESNIRKSKIRFEGAVTSPSRAGKTLKHSINPGGTGETSGWTFWKLRDPSTNQERPISDLRQDNELVRRLLSHYRQG